MLLHVDVQLSQHRLLKDYSFPVEWFWCPCPKSTAHKRRSSALNSEFCSIYLRMSSPMPDITWSRLL